MSARVEFEAAFVLSRRPYRETSHLVELFSRGYGRVGCVARGMRAQASRRGAVLQPFALVSASWRESGELATLTAVESAGLHAELSGERVFSGWYANELLLRLLARRDPHPGLFEDYAGLLVELAGAGSPQPAMRRFEKHLLAELGYGLDLPDSLEPARHYHFDPDHGLSDAPGPEGEIPGHALIALRDEVFDTPEDLRWARRLLKRALDRQLGPAGLRTPELWRRLHPVAGGVPADG